MEGKKKSSIGKKTGKEENSQLNIRLIRQIVNINAIEIPNLAPLFSSLLLHISSASYMFSSYSNTKAITPCVYSQHASQVPREGIVRNNSLFLCVCLNYKKNYLWKQMFCIQASTKDKKGRLDITVMTWKVSTWYIFFWILFENDLGPVLRKPVGTNHIPVVFDTNHKDIPVQGNLYIPEFFTNKNWYIHLEASISETD